MPTSELSITPGFGQTTVWPQDPGNKEQTVPYSVSVCLGREEGLIWFCSSRLLRAPHKLQFFIFDTLTLYVIKQEAKSKALLSKNNQSVHVLPGVLAAAPSQQFKLCSGCTLKWHTQWPGSESGWGSGGLGVGKWGAGLGKWGDSSVAQLMSGMLGTLGSTPSTTKAPK